MLVVGGGGPSLRIYCLKKIEASASIYEEQCTGLAELEGERVVPRGTGASRNHVVRKQRHFSEELRR